VLADLEATAGTGNSIADYFDLVTGTSTGGIIALGLGAGKSAREIRDLYMHRGPEIFPPVWDNIVGRGWKAFRNNILNATFHRYSRQALERVLQEFLGDKILGESIVRHVIPAFDGRFSEVFLFKTRHHPDYEQDWRKRMVDIGLATSAAPTIYRSLESSGYRLIDGGIWANNPTMLAVVEAMIAYDVPRERIKVLSIGCGDEPYHVTRRMTWGGLWHWRKIIGAAMRAQSLAATSQARLLLGPANVVRIDPTLVGPPIELDDYRRAMDELLPAVSASLAAHRTRIEEVFLRNNVERFVPVP
jgi:patatin-like phospholipase/acyl hydrolase